MIILLFIELLIVVFFILGVLFFAVTLPWTWAVAVNIPVVAMFLVYLKLDRVDASMNETRRELDAFRMDHRLLAWGIFLVLVVAGVFAVLAVAQDVQLLPVARTNEAFERLERLEKRFVESERHAKAILDELKEHSKDRKEMIRLMGRSPGSTPAEKEMLKVLRDLKALLVEIKETLAEREGKEP